MAKNQQRQTDGQTEESKKREDYLLFRWRGESAFSVPPVEKEKKSVKGGREREREGGRERERGREGERERGRGGEGENKTNKQKRKKTRVRTREKLSAIFIVGEGIFDMTEVT